MRARGDDQKMIDSVTRDRLIFLGQALVRYCHFDVSPINYSDSEELNHNASFSGVMLKNQNQIKCRKTDEIIGGKIKSDQETVDVLNNYFVSVFEKEGDTQLPDFPEQQYTTELLNAEITEDKANILISKLKPSKSQDLDNFHPKLIYIHSPCRRCAVQFGRAGNCDTVNQRCRALELVEPS